jgi:hypothetical protein
MVSALLAGTDAAVTIRDADGEVILDRLAAARDGTERHEITVDRDVLGTVEGGRTARAVASVLAYAAARERDKRSLATEALERYRELSLIYDLAATIGGAADETAVVAAAVRELGRLPGEPVPFVVLVDERGGLVGASGPFAQVALGEGVVGGAVERGEADLVDDVADEPFAAAAERGHRAIVVAPLRVDDRTIGAIGAASSTPAAFRAADLKVVAAIAALAGPAIGQHRRHAAPLGPATEVDQPVPR